MIINFLIIIQEIYEFGQYKKEEKITGVIVMYDTGGGVFYDGMWQQSG